MPHLVGHADLPRRQLVWAATETADGCVVRVNHGRVRVDGEERGYGASVVIVAVAQDKGVGLREVDIERVGVAGEQTYREALKNISRELRVQKVEMDAVTSAYGANQNSIEALSAKQEALTKQQDAHREKVQILSEMLLEK